MSEKSLSNSALNLIVGKIHQAYTVACDELFMRGYFTQDERMAIGGLIGDLLQQLRDNLLMQIPVLAATVVTPDDVDWIVYKDILVDEALSEYKAGARHSSTDNKNLQAIHDAAVELGASCPMMIFKEESGKYRWVLFSSSAFQDRDGEIVSTKAQEADCDRLNESGAFGPLRWWHVGRPYRTVEKDWRSYTAGKGLDLGECDASVMIGRIRVETGTFFNSEVGERLKEVADELSVSIGFSHPDDQPNSKGEFDDIHTFERSLLPKGKQSNYFASVPIIEKESAMDKQQKVEALKTHLKGITDLVFDRADQADKEAEATGAKFKAKDDKPEDEGEGKKPFAFGSEADAKAFVKKCMDEYMSAGKEKSEKESEDLKTTLESLQTSLKDAAANNDKIAKSMSDSVSAINEQLKVNSTAIKGLQGELPKSLARMARSNAEDNVIPDAEAKLKGPKQENRDGADSFFDWATGKVEQKIPAG